MGYLGFGLQKWIYNQKPRKPYSNVRKQEYESIPQSHRDFVIHKESSTNSFRLKALVSLGIAIVIISFSVYLIKGYFDYSKTHETQANATNRKIENEAFAMLFKSGTSYFKGENWIKAKSEFELGLKINPSNTELNEYYCFTLFNLYKQGGIDSLTFATKLDSLILKFPKNEKIMQIKIDFKTLTLNNEIKN